MAAQYEILIEQQRAQPYVRREQLPTSRDNFYVFEDGRRLWLGYVPAWCPRCGAIVLAEHLDTPAQIEEAVAHFERWGPSAERDRHLAELAFRRQWLWARRSPPRCLRCFADDALLFPLGRRVRHPGGQASWLTAEMTGFSSPVRSGEWILTPEGLPWPDGKVPPPSEGLSETEGV